ncbi:MAG: exodeoxyribonuclease V subunit gamma [Desulfotalea sp.]
MFFLHISNRTENLLAHLAAVIKQGGREDIFTKELFLIQSQGMERIISQSLASEFKTWCNFKYHLPLGFFKEIVACLSSADLISVSEDDFYDRKNILWQIEALLRDVDNQLLADYLQGDLAELKRFQLAKKISNIFDQYQLMRPEILASWAKSVRLTDNVNEIWQMDLWQKLSNKTEEPHRGEVFENIIKILDNKEEIANLPKRVSVFGLHIMPPLYLDFLRALSKHCDVHLYVLSPCKEYWGDVETKQALVHRLLKCKKDGGEISSFEEEEPQQLLASLGRQGRDFQRMLVENVDFNMKFASYVDPVEEYNSSRLLHIIQSDLLTREISGVDVAADESLQIVSCHSRFRELAVLKDYLLKRLYEDEDLKLRDIVVMAPDIQEYAPLIPAVFSDIYHSIADRALRRRNSVMAAFGSYLQLFAGRFGWTEVLDLLRLEQIYPQFDLSEGDFEYIQKWVLESGIRWGIDSKHRDDLGLAGFDLNTWHSGLEKLLLGLTMSSDSEFAGIIPYDDIEGGIAQALGGLCEFLSCLKSCREKYQKEYSLDDWAELLLGDAEKLFGDSDETLELQTILSSLIGIENEQTHSFKVISSWLEQTANESRSSSGFLRGQLTFCSMLPMRSIPFKVVCLLGLQEGEFPKQDRLETFDLMANMPRLGDRSPRVDDRYQFLEAIISARDFLYLSYVGRSIKNNDKIPSSVVVSELLDVLNDNYDLKNLVVEHPLYPFSKKYFVDDNPLFSFDKTNLKISKAIAQKGSAVETPWWDGELAVVEPSVSLSALISFYKNPQVYFVKNILDIRLGREDSFPENSELFESSGLDRYLLQEAIIKDVLAGSKSEISCDKYSREGRWPIAGPGEVAYEKLTQDLSEFTEQIISLDLGQATTLSVDTTSHGIRLVGEVQEYERGRLFHRFANRKGKDLMLGGLYHLIAGEIFGCKKTTYLLCKDGLTTFENQPAEPILHKYLEQFLVGCRTLSHFHVESAYKYIEQAEKKRASKLPIVAAKETFHTILEKGYEPETSLVVTGMKDDFLNDEFIDLTLELMLPILDCTKIDE